MEDEEKRLIEILQSNKGRIAKSKVGWASEDLLKRLENKGIIEIKKHGLGYTIILKTEIKTNTFESETKLEEQNKDLTTTLTEINKKLDLLSKINEKLDLILEKLGHSSTSFTNADFDKIFEEVKNPLGVASLKDIRERMGLSKEEFYSRFSQYIEANYQMYRGGDEGIVKNGVIFGIIKR